jgi:hypothetical protein
VANNTTLNSGTLGDTITDLDMTTFTAYPTTGKLPCGAIYVGALTSAAPTPVANANPFPVAIVVGGAQVDPRVITSIGGTVAVSGTFWQATQPVSGTFWQATQPISAASLPLPTGAALEAGNLATIVTSVANIPAKGQALAAASTPVVLTAAQIVTLTPPAAITGFALETGGNLAAIKADTDKIPSQGQALAAASTPVVLTAIQVSALTPLATVAVSTVTTVSTVTAVTAITNALPAGTNLLGCVSLEGAISGGDSVYSVLTTTAVVSASVKASAGQAYGIHCFNPTATIAYGALYNQTTAPATTDTANIVYRFVIPANANGAGFVVPIPNGIAFGTGIGIRVHGAAADNDNTAIGANMMINVLYK